MIAFYPFVIQPFHYFTIRAVINSRGPGISPDNYECGLRLLLLENRRKFVPKETPRCLIPCLLVVFTQQLEILATTLTVNYIKDMRTCKKMPEKLSNV